MRAVFDHAEDVAPHIRTFWFKPEKPARFIAGQFTELYLPHDADERGERRWFTISSSPTEPLIAITTKFSTARSSTYKRQLGNLQLGTEVHLAEPMGDFVLPKDASLPLVFVAGGMGITPMRSMVKWLQDTNQARTIHLIYAVTEADDLAFRSLLDSGTTLTPYVKSEQGSLTVDRLFELAPDDGRTTYYFSGPEPMVETFYKSCTERGLGQERLVTDYFPGYRQF